MCPVGVTGEPWSSQLSRNAYRGGYRQQWRAIWRALSYQLRSQDELLNHDWLSRRFEDTDDRDRLCCDARAPTMSARGILARVMAIVTWPASRFTDVRRTYDLTLGASDVCALIRGEVAVDPLFRPVGEGFAQSSRPEVVARVIDQRFEMYISGKSASGVGLIGEVEDTSTGSRVVTKVAWAGPTKYAVPALTILMLIAVVALASEIPTAISDSGFDAWPAVALAALIGGGYVASLISRARRAENHELPMLFARLDAVLGRHVQAGMHL